MVGKKGYVPERGDIVWLDFNPQTGHKQRGRRPALTLSFRAYNEKIGLGLFCPIASKVKGYPFEVEIVSGVIQGAVLSDQIKSLDWVERNIEFIEKIDSAKLQEVIEKIEVIIK
ncbi:toxin of the ChpA-ChpR toxin-antitoxin system, endoribonuclease [uncultured spirochete]|jgi:mRNA interferase MazF|uniref:Toxin of the ChpA-ChpR toxin-antitoxin system, endoribonuclease n=1 Tax=uncultured spirochete TaxID=156406 RepID=A0A3P3XP93_9SPIR|nr:toxin of the ChpA-ChpR toxin-antitoxin system, endoribonuclease [uncultured spirochete]